MSNNAQSSETDFLYTLASNGRFDRIADYVASNEALAVRYGAAGILTEFAGDLKTAATTELRKKLINAVLEEPDDRVRARVVEALLYIDESILDTLVTKIAADREPTPTDSPHPLLLVEWLGSDSVELRLLAVAGLGDVGTPSMIPKLSSACSDTDRRVRERALKELGRIGNPRCVEEVADCLDSDIASIRHEAAKTLGEINTRGAIDRLRPAGRRDEDDELRRIALDQLGTFPSSDVINTLSDGVTDENPEIQQAAASSLMELISSASFEESHTIREEVAEEIEALDEDVVPAFVTLFTDTHRQRSVETPPGYWVGSAITGRRSSTTCWMRCRTTTSRRPRSPPPVSPGSAAGISKTGSKSSSRITPKGRGHGHVLSSS
jgi:FOG: HEAT repeat